MTADMKKIVSEVLEGQNLVLQGLFSGRLDEMDLMGVVVGWGLDRKDGFTPEQCEGRARRRAFDQHLRKAVEKFYSLPLSERDALYQWVHERM